MIKTITLYYWILALRGIIYFSRLLKMLRNVFKSVCQSLSVSSLASIFHMSKLSIVLRYVSTWVWRKTGLNVPLRIDSESNAV